MRGARTDSSAAYAWGVVAILFVINLIGYLDRQILILMIGPIKHDLGLSDGAFGLIHGSGFVVTYALAGLFIGRLIDRGHRRNVLLVCLLLWTMFTALSGFARSGMELFIARMGVGFGEAALIPAAVSLLGDYFDERRRGRAVGVFMTGTYVGLGCSLAMTALLLPMFAQLSGWLAVGGIEAPPWRLLLGSMLPAGLAGAVLLLAVREPRGKGWTPPPPPVAARALSYWFERADLYFPHHLGFAALAFCGFGLHAWAPAVLMREYGFSPAATGITYGLLVTLTGCLGAALGGWTGDVVLRRFPRYGRMAAAAPFIVLAATGIAIAFGAPSAWVLVAGYGALNIGLSAALVVGLTSITDIAPVEVRARVTAVYLLFSGLFGMGLAPALMGYANDLLGGLGFPLSDVVATFCGVGLGLAALLIAIASRRLPAMAPLASAASAPA